MDYSRKALLSSTVSQSLLRLMSMESVMLSNYLILLLLPSIFPNIRVFSNESALHIRWPKYWRFSFSLCPSKALISFRIDWFDLLAVQGTLKSPFQHHNSKVLILLALSLLYGPALTSVHNYWINRSFVQTFVSKMMSRFLICSVGLS